MAWSLVGRKKTCPEKVHVDPFVARSDPHSIIAAAGEQHGPNSTLGEMDAPRIRPPAPEQIHITVTPRVSGCGEYASDLALDLKIDNASRRSLHFDVVSELRNPPILYWDAFNVLDTGSDQNVVDKRLSPSPTIPVFGIADHATVESRDTGDVVALLEDVHPDDAKVLRIELHDPREHSYLSEPFSLCGDVTTKSATGQYTPELSAHAALPLTLNEAGFYRYRPWRA